MLVRVILSDNDRFRNMEYICKRNIWDSNVCKSAFGKSTCFTSQNRYFPQKKILGGSDSNLDPVDKLKKKELELLNEICLDEISQWDLLEAQERQIFSVNEGSLPSHIQTIRLGKNSEITLEYKKTGLGQRLRGRCCAIFLTLMLIFLVSLAVSLAVWFYNGKDNKNDDMRQWSLASEGAGDFERDNSTTATDRSEQQKTKGLRFTQFKSREDNSGVDVTQRVKCKNRCREYSAFRFNSTCLRHHCACYGKGYQRDTCLPSFNKCAIKRQMNSIARASFSKTKQTSYSCRPKIQSSEEVHVLSCFGNDFKGDSVVEIKDNRGIKTPIILVLANYQMMKWNIRITSGSKVKKIYLLSNKHLANTEVIFHSDDMTSQPEVEKLFSHTGYGEDKRGGRTVEMLDTVYRKIGNISSFTGTSKADFWEIQL